MTDLQDQEENFDEKSKKILEHLRSEQRYSGFLPRPFIIEFTGSPSSGKSTAIRELDKFLRRQGFARIWTPQEGAEAIRHVSRSTPLYNLRTGIYALTILIDEMIGNKYDIMIFDRGIFDAYGWMMYWAQKGQLNPNEVYIFQNFFLSRFWSQYIDIAYFMICDPLVAYNREQKVALNDKKGDFTNPDTIGILVNRYRDAYARLSPLHRQIKLVDTTHMDENQVLRFIANDVLDTLSEKTNPRA